MKRIFVVSPLRGSQEQFDAVAKQVHEAIDRWKADGTTDPVMLQSFAARFRNRLLHNLYAENTAVTERLCLEVTILGHAPYAPHLFFTRFLRDSDPDERLAGIVGGLAWMAASDEVWVYRRHGISDGMTHEIAAAAKMGKPVHSPAGWLP